jgi:hypothetical protein
MPPMRDYGFRTGDDWIMFDKEPCKPKQPESLGSRIVRALGNLVNAKEIRITTIRQEMTPDGPLTTRERKVFRK